MPRAIDEMKKASLLAWYTGLSPLRYDNKELYVSKLLVAFIIANCLLMTTVSLSTDTVFNMRKFEGQLYKVVLAPLGVLSSTLIFYSSLYALCQIKRLNRFLHYVDLVDAYLEKFNATTHPVYRGILFPILSTACILVSLILSSQIIMVKSAESYFWHHLVWIMIPIPVHQMRGVLFIVSSRIQVILSLMKVAKTHNSLCILTKCHSLVVRSAEELDNAFSIMFFSVILFVTIFLIGELYSLWYLTYMFQCTKMLVRLVWISYGLTIIIPLVFTCNLISEQAQEFYFLMYRFMIHDKSGCSWNNTFMSVYTCLKKDIRFSAFGVFYVDNKLLKTITVTILTHLIILIQVSKDIPHS